MSVKFITKKKVTARRKIKGEYHINLERELFGVSEEIILVLHKCMLYAMMVTEYRHKRNECVFLYDLSSILSTLNLECKICYK